MIGGAGPSLDDLIGGLGGFGGLGGPSATPASKNEVTNSYMEESTDAAGHHTTKKVTEGNGWKQVEIQSDGPMDIGSLIGQMM